MPRPPARRASVLADVRAQAAGCRDCPLWKNATQTVFGAGPAGAAIMLVGEQPGDREDIEGLPFVGPAGRLLDRALEQAGIDRSATYLTNAVKHFKFEPRGKRRIHKKPNELEIAACHQWLERELALIRPRLVIVLGATAARAIFGRSTAIGKHRGHIIRAGQVRHARRAAMPAKPPGNDTPRAKAKAKAKAKASPGLPDPDILVTVHPSFLLRVPAESKSLEYERFVSDLQLAQAYA